MREIRLYGSDGGEAKAFPTPIQLSGRTDADMEWVNDSGSSAGSSAIGRASTLLSGEVRAWVAGRTGI